MIVALLSLHLGTAGAPSSLAHDASLVFYSFLTSFLGWPVVWGLYRLTHPYRCKCGRLHWRASSMMDHLEMKHVRDTV